MTMRISSPPFNLFIFAFFVVLFSAAHSAWSTPLMIPGKATNSKDLPYMLLNEFIQRSDRFDTIEFAYGDKGEASFSQTLADINAGALDIMWTATSKDYETDFQAIYIPIYQGTLGMRLAIINQNDKHKFSHITHKDDFLHYVACQGKLWADTPILEANNILVAKSLKYPNLFKMLSADRCDYFPRAIFEPWSEIERENQYNLTVDTHVLLRYTMPFLFFVKKDNTELSDHITQVFQEMKKDGTFDTLFFQDKKVKNALELSHLRDRIIIDLNNPFLSQEVKNIPPEYWFDPMNDNRTLLPPSLQEKTTH
ncbi:transporter substrate-binding domain-containing protein [Marinibactrum halimedae]|nr:transporter substrate-binding domain-containing protein [Marinibactrum halimedae]